MRNVNDLLKYCKEQNFEWKKVQKFMHVFAKLARPGEELDVIASNGVKETHEIAKDGQCKIYNAGNEHNMWFIDFNVLVSKYVKVSNKKNKNGFIELKPKGIMLCAGPLVEDISFTAPWGTKENVKAGGYILQDIKDKANIYGISKVDFDNTYEFIDK